ncbi:MAG: hypothetical protein CL799_10905 [Chromatiales bacterium]|jgi:hypothetical protein|nr:hypothetical protein [Chromatiales bacterium]MDP6150022.1 DUF1838 family protein [Gammaproteobacteria bacterium]MDP7094183.1 DUF1838 family protein [Gammaproteobacteria bacterium]MDP7271984.1 DUF1838 family protein [Gammaproteobacteria bacterium]HJP03997.1 DUF1838 family protein [Gammaproteobacteria bacterium]
MIAKINPADIEPAEAFGGSPMTRRAMLGNAGLLLGAGALAGCAQESAPQQSAPQAAPAASLNLDFSKADDNLTAWVKLVSSLEDGKETCGFFSGIHYAIDDAHSVIKPLFRIQGFGMSRVTKLPDGRYENLHREAVFYLDLKENRIMETWDNPYTGEEVEIFNTHNDPVNSYYASSFKQSFGDPEAGIETIEFPFILPWETFGDRAVVSFAVNTRWPTPLDPEKWKREHFGPWYRTSEYFQIHSSLAELNNPDMPKVPFTGAWQKIAPWHPWMLMDNRPGGLLGISSVWSLDSTDDLPTHIREYAEEHYPRFLHAPEKWEEPNMATWETFAKERTPAPVKE